MYTGNEGRILSKEEVKTGVDNEALLHAEDPDYLKFEFIGRDIYEQLLSLPGCVGLRNYIMNDNRRGVALVPVDSDGKPIPTEELGGLKDGAPGAGGGGGVKCPTSCG